MNTDSAPLRLDGVHVLLVEDDPDLLDALAEHLTAVGATVTCASSVKAARAALDGGRFDLLVSDIGLPDGSGHEVVLAARGSGRVRAAMALTGNRENDAVDSSRAAGFQMHLTKPCDPAMLVRIAQILLQEEP